jgi:anaerobic selenocysteine-containing dehydrogenase
MFNATKQMKMSKARGMKLIVVDPRRTETAEYADVFLQPQPGEDATVFAGLIRIILKESWHDTQFCDRYVSGIAQLSAAVEPFTPSYVQSRAGLSPELMRRAAEVFARDGRRGIATTGTGTTMAPHSNLADHLVECLNVVCGRMLREGERVANPGVSTPYRPFRAQVVPPNRTWDIGHHGNTGFGTLNGEMMSATLADEILTPGDGRIRALVIAGANPAVCLPNQRHAVKALRALDLLVAIEPYMTASAKLCHYILPPKLQYERTDVTFGPMLEQILNPLPFQQYIPAICTAPAGSEVCDDWYVFWSLAKRLGMPLEFAGQRLEFDVVPTTDELLTIMLRGSRVPFEEIAKYPEGRIFDVSDQFVEPGQPNQNTRFEIAPHDVIEEIASVAAERLGNDGYAYRLAVRRMRDVSNSLGQNFAASLRRGAYNPAFIHPEDLQALNLESGDAIQIQSAFGCISAIAESDDTLRPGVVSISHCWGGLPGERSDEQKGSSTNLLITTESRVESINAMAWMTAVPINVRRLSEVSV